MRRVIRVSGIAVFLAMTPLPAVEAQDLAALREVVPALMQEHLVPGVALAVVQDGRVVLLEGFGVARVRDSVPVDPETTIFRLASVAKLFVASIVVEAAERGVVDLHADVRSYVPDVPIPDTFDDPITLHHLLTHTAGFEERLIGYAAPNREAIRPLGEYLAANLPKRVWAPGRVTGYSNHGVALAAYAVERATGVAFREYARRSLFEPLSMQSTSYREPLASLEADRAEGHDCDESGCVAAPEVYSHPYPVGLAYTTAADMSRFILAQLGERTPETEMEEVLSPAVLQRLQAEAFTHDTALPGMSYGFFNQTVRGHRALSHAGSASGLDHLLLIVPKRRIGFYFVANGGRSRFGRALRDSILTRLVPASVEPDRSPPARLSAAYLESLTGPYQLTRHARTTIEKFPFIFATTVVVALDGEQHLRIRNPDGNRVFEAVDSLRFREVDGDGSLAFGRDDRGRITHMYTGVPAFGSEVPGAFEKRRWYDAPRFQNEYVSWLMGGPLIGLLIVWPTAAGLAWWRRRRTGQRVRQNGRGPALAIAAVLAFYVLFAVFGFGFVARSTRMLAGSTGIVHGMTGDMLALLAIPYALAILSLALVWFGYLAWRRSYWSAFRRVLYSALTITGALVILFLMQWNYLPPSW